MNIVYSEPHKENWIMPEKNRKPYCWVTYSPETLAYNIVAWIKNCFALYKKKTKQEIALRLYSASYSKPTSWTAFYNAHINTASQITQMAFPYIIETTIEVIIFAITKLCMKHQPMPTGHFSESNQDTGTYICFSPVAHTSVY